jgi:hypothetical protein
MAEPIPTSDPTAPKVSQAPAPKKDGAIQKLAKWLRLFIRKSQYMNSKNMSPIDAEQAARRDLGLPLLTDEDVKRIREKTSLSQRVDKVVGSKVLQKTGLSKVINEKLSWAWSEQQASSSKQQAVNSKQQNEPVAPATEGKVMEGEIVKPAETPVSVASEAPKTEEKQN